MNKSLIGAILFLSAIAIPVGTFAQLVGEKDVLLGLAKVSVAVERLKPEIERDGLYATTIKSDAEMKLKMAGMEIGEPEDSPQSQEVPCLVIQVNAMKYSDGYMYDARVFLREPVVLLRKQIRISGTTLRIRGQFGCTSHLSDIREEARDAVDNFIRVWQEANPANP